VSKPPTSRYAIAVAIATLAALFHLYAAGFSPFTALVQRPVHLIFMATLGFLGVGVPDVRATRWRDALSILLVALALLSFGYLAVQNESLVRRAGSPTSLDLVAGAIAIVLVLELARRATGWGLVVIALLSLGYAVAGPYLPGMLAHRGYGPIRLIEHLYLSAEGIWGIPLGVSADFVYLFVLFGTLLEAAGGGELLISLASRVAGRMRGAPAMTASLASAFMGSLSGSAVANVVTTGTLTIPLMKRAGFKAHFAAAIEAAASTGGQIMPPIMGAGAFIMATWTNIPYSRIAAAALVPALLYYLSLVAAIHFRATRMNLARGGDQTYEPALPRLHLLAPVAVIVVFLALGRSPMRAAFWGVITAALATFLSRRTRLDAKGLRDALTAGAASTVQVAAACATAGIVVGVASLTGIGLRMSELIVQVSNGYLPVALVLTAAGSIVLGLGLPTTAAYVVLAALGAPALVQLGVPLLAAHMFIFYFGCISNVTPPVALAAYAAAGIAGASPVRTAAIAMLLASAGFIVPFMFVYGPALLLIGPPAAVALAIVTASAGVIGLAAAIIGYARRPLVVWERALVAAAAIGLIFPGWMTDLFGFCALVLIFRGRAIEPAPAQEATVRAPHAGTPA
jgi:TRAP transporter 4TM/12TM fusion protein